jgi:hypothetical protein
MEMSFSNSHLAGHHAWTLTRRESASPFRPHEAGADGASRFVGAKIPMVKRVLTSPNLCYGGRQCGGRPRS